MFISLTACVKEETKATPVPAPVAVTSPLPALAATTKKVCRDVVTKDKKIKNQCKTIKIHKKFDGTKVPEKVKK